MTSGPTGSGASAHVDFVRRYLAAVEAGATGDALAQFFTPDVVQEEFPNRVVPNGARRDLAGILDAAERGQRAVTRQRFEVRSLTVEGDRLALECLWIGTLAVPFGSIPPGGEMRAHLAIVIEFRDGKIAAQRNYDCYDPF